MKKFVLFTIGFTKPTPEIMEPWMNWFKSIEESAAMAYADCRPRIPESFEIISTVGIYVSRALSGELSVEEAMKKANEEIKALLKKGGYTMSE